MFRRLERDERGITLIELLVAILIISILTVASHGYYIKQRRKGWMAQVIAATKNMASVQEFWFNTIGTGGYTLNLQDLLDAGYNFSAQDVAPTVVAAGPAGFCLEVSSRHDPTLVWHYSSYVGHPEEGPADAVCTTGALLASDPSSGTTTSGTAVAAAVTTSSGTSDSTGSSSSSSTSASGSSSDSSDTSSTTSGSTTSDGGSQTSGGGSSSGEGQGNGDGSDGNGSGGSGSGGSGSGGSGGSGGGNNDRCEGGSDGEDGGGNHPSGKSRDDDNGSGGKSESDPDGDRNGGSDKPGGDGGQDAGDRDGNNGSGNDDDFEDDNRGRDKDGNGRNGDDCEVAAPLVLPW